MTPQQIDTREERANRLSTAELANNLNSDPRPAPGRPTNEPNVPLFAQNDAQDFRTRWEKIQAGFVDEPREAVVQADELVAGVIKRLAEVFATERHNLETEWDKKDDVSTEDLRVALRRYRSFFDRLLSV